MDNNRLYQIVLIVMTLVMCSARAYSNGQVFSYGSWLQRHWPWWLATDIPNGLLYLYGWQELLISPIYILSAISLQFTLHHIFYKIGEETYSGVPQAETPAIIFWLTAVVCGLSVLAAWTISLARGTVSELLFSNISLIGFVLIFYLKVKNEPLENSK